MVDSKKEAPGNVCFEFRSRPRWFSELTRVLAPIRRKTETRCAKTSQPSLLRGAKLLGRARSLSKSVWRFLAGSTKRLKGQKDRLSPVLNRFRFQTSSEQNFKTASGTRYAHTRTPLGNTASIPNNIQGCVETWRLMRTQCLLAEDKGILPRVKTAASRRRACGIKPPQLMSSNIEVQRYLFCCKMHFTV